MLIKIDKQTIKENPLFAFSICLCITLFIIIGLTTPVVGAIVRYKVPGLLLLVVAMVLGSKFKVQGSKFADTLNFEP